MRTAQQWRERLGMKRNSEWDRVIAKLSALPALDGVYLAHENCPQTYSERNYDHPSMLGALGMLTGDKVNRETMRRTLKKVMKEVPLADGSGTVPIQLMWSNAVSGPEGPIAAPHLATH